MTARCLAEQCLNWSGDGCVCEAMGVDPVCATCEIDGMCRQHGLDPFA